MSEKSAHEREREREGEREERELTGAIIAARLAHSGMHSIIEYRLINPETHNCPHVNRLF